MQSSSNFQLWRQHERSSSRIFQNRKEDLHETSRALRYMFVSCMKQLDFTFCFPLSSSSLDQWIATEKLFQSLQVIPFIASNYRRDKIWLRRTKPSKREYQAGDWLEDIWPPSPGKNWTSHGKGLFCLRAFLQIHLKAGAHNSPRYTEMLTEATAFWMNFVVVTSCRLLWPLITLAACSDLGACIVIVIIVAVLVGVVANIQVDLWLKLCRSEERVQCGTDCITDTLCFMPGGIHTSGSQHFILLFHCSPSPPPDLRIPEITDWWPIFAPPTSKSFCCLDSWQALAQLEVGEYAVLAFGSVVILLTGEAIASTQQWQVKVKRDFVKRSSSWRSSHPLNAQDQGYSSSPSSTWFRAPWSNINQIVESLRLSFAFVFLNLFFCNSKRSLAL